MSPSPTLHRVLVGIQTEIDPRLATHKKVAKALYRITDVHGISAVYHFFDEEEEGLTVVYSLRTQTEPLELKKKIKEVQKTIKSPGLSIQILVFDDVVLRAVDVVLPSMELHRLKRWCVPAADLWGDYVHPIEGKDLKMLSETTGSLEKIEFYAQSKTLLDFLSRET